MATLAIEGCQWGDEGKGKITDYYAAKADVIVRSQGGNNAGHSIVHGGKKYALRLLPSGIFNPKAINVLADGMVIDPWALINEITGIEEAGVTGFHLLISSRAQILMPYHIDIDHAREASLGNAKIGTTGRGIGPCYEDKAARLGIRMGDLLESDYLRQQLEHALAVKNKVLGLYGIQPYMVDDLYLRLHEAGIKLQTYIGDTSSFINKSLADHKRVLFEGAQGAMLCLDHGTYPFVTSSSPLATAIPVDCGIPLSSVETILGIVKAYSTRVGAGPFPSEIGDLSLASLIRERGHEYGTVTKRPRRVGWIDTAELRYVQSISGVKYVSLMLLDVLSCVEEIKICTKYTLDGQPIDYMPSTVEEYGRVVPVYETLPSWKEDISICHDYGELPSAARAYVKRIEELTGLEVVIVSVGPDKDQTIVRKEIF
jgi:adenylosuccinate synthase